MPNRRLRDGVAAVVYWFATQATNRDTPKSSGFAHSNPSGGIASPVRPIPNPRETWSAPESFTETLRPDHNVRITSTRPYVRITSHVRITSAAASSAPSRNPPCAGAVSVHTKDTRPRPSSRKAAGSPYAG